MPKSQRKTQIELPVDAILPVILDMLQEERCLVIEAPPGAGKTTRVPRALLELVSGEVVVLEPRRIAARMAAGRVAWEMGEAVGETVGYQVRFEEVGGARTRLRFVTEGVLTRRLLGDPLLKGVSAVVLDEFHERHLEGDLALAWLKRLQKKRPELRVVVMSATLDGAAVAEYLGEGQGGSSGGNSDGSLRGCPVVRSEGTRFELSIRHLGYSAAALEVRVREAVELLEREGHRGDTLVFLPGVAEIRRAMRECAGVARAAGLLVLPLHGSLSPQEQDRALAPAAGEQRKLILATNVAESSVTVEGVSAVIDSGLARVASSSPWSGLPTLTVGRVSQASAKQRAGRAGRCGAGRVLRLYSEEELLRRPEQDLPEMVRSDLSGLCLELRALGIGSAREMDWLDAPPAAAVERAEALLQRLGAEGKMAERLARFPLGPRLARIVVEAVERGVGEAGCRAAALLGSGAQSDKNDLLAAMEGEQDYRTLQQLQQLRRIARVGRARKDDIQGVVKDHLHDDALLMAVLVGFPDRVARRRGGVRLDAPLRPRAPGKQQASVRANTQGAQVLLSGGGSAEIAGEDPGYEFMVVVDAEDRKDKALPLIRMTARIEPEWLLELFPERVRESETVSWNREGERVEAVSALLYDELVIEESRGAMPDKDAAAALLAQKTLEAGIERFVDVAALEEFRERAAFAGMAAPSAEDALREMCSGRRSFAELKAAAERMIATLEAKLGGRLREWAPARLRLPNGRMTAVHYEAGKAPWIASRLQDFFGMKETPRIGPEKSPVVVHLLAPNKRAVQTTTDLAGFWERLYPQVRRELMRRYPKHDWPERV